MKFHKLKHLRDLEIDFTGRNVTGTFGVNGSGKSSILHALACFYRSLNPGSETNYFTRFFKRVNAEAWVDSAMTVCKLPLFREGYICKHKKQKRFAAKNKSKIPQKTKVNSAISI